MLYKNSNNQLSEFSSLALIGVIVAYIMWWIANFKNSNFDITDVNSPIGGNTDKPLANG